MTPTPPSNIITPFGNSPEDPLVEKLHNSVRRACNKDAPLIFEADAMGHVKAPPAQRGIELTPFSDGVLFRCSPNPAKPGSFVIHDGAGQAVALALNEEIADILCKGCHLFFQHAQRAMKSAETPVVVDTPTT